MDVSGKDPTNLIDILDRKFSNNFVTQEYKRYIAEKAQDKVGISEIFSTAIF